MSDGGVWDNSPVIGENTFAQRVGEGERTKFEQTPMMLIDHEDVAKHMIGESLPPPSASLVRRSNTLSFGNVGTSPIVARADHYHDNGPYHAYYYQNDKVCAPGQAFFDGLIFGGGVSSTLVGGSQLIDYPAEGVYILNLTGFNERSGGGDFTGQAEISFWYLNGGFARGMWNRRIAGATTHPSDFWNCTDVVFVSNNANDNVQFSYSHNDSVNHLVTVVITLARIGSLNGTP